MELKIEIPAKVEYMRVKHLPFLTELEKYKDREPTLPAIKRMVSMFTGHSMHLLGRIPQKELRALFLAICKVFQQYEQKPVKMELEYPDENGKPVQYEFPIDFTTLPVDWFIDFDRVDLEENPIDMMAFAYIEKGMTYNQPVPDGSENVMNPREKRAKIFAEHCPLTVYLDVQAFFLASWNVLQSLSTKARSPQT